MGKEVVLDLKIGYLHAYPNGELQFESVNPAQSTDNPGTDQRYLKRSSNNDEEQSITEKNLERIARAMSVGLNSASCFQSVKTPSTSKTFKSKKMSEASSKFSRQSNSLCKNWYESNKMPAILSHKTKSMQRLPKNDIYSQFSKQTYKTYESIQSQTQSRISKNETSEKEEVLSRLRANEYVPMTLQQFLEKQASHTGKRVLFA